MEEFNIIERKYHANLSKMGAGRGTSRFFALLLIIWGIGLLYLLWFYPEKLKIGDMSIFIYLFAISLIIGGVWMIVNTFIYKNHFNKKFDERKILRINLIKGIPTIIGMAIFFSMFIAVGWYGGHKPFLFIGLLFFVIFIGAGIYGLIKTLQRLANIKALQESELRYMSRSPFRLGDSLQFELLNSSPSIQGKEITATLRFLNEKFLKKSNKSKKNKDSKALKTICIYEDYSNNLLKSGKLECEFLIPTVEVGPTEIEYSEPKYWELEFSNKPEHFYARFILDIQDQFNSQRIFE